jgi:hypothetical protein
MAQMAVPWRAAVRRAQAAALRLGRRRGQGSRCRVSDFTGRKGGWEGGGWEGGGWVGGGRGREALGIVTAGEALANLALGRGHTCRCPTLQKHVSRCWAAGNLTCPAVKRVDASNCKFATPSTPRCPQYLPHPPPIPLTLPLSHTHPPHAPQVMAGIRAAGQLSVIPYQCHVHVLTRPARRVLTTSLRSPSLEVRPAWFSGSR